MANIIQNSFLFTFHHHSFILTCCTMQTCVQSTWALSISSRDPPACAALSLHLLLMLPLPLPLLLQFDQHFVEVVRWRPHAACGSSRRLRARERAFRRAMAMALGSQCMMWVSLYVGPTAQQPNKQTDRPSDWQPSPINDWATKRPTGRPPSSDAEAAPEPKPDQGDCPLRMAFFELSSPRD